MEDPKILHRRRRAYRRVNLLLTGAGLTLALAGVPPRAPEMEAIRRALRAVNLAGGIEGPLQEDVHVQFPSGPRRRGQAG